MKTVLDASALLALLHNEKGADEVKKALFNEAVISSVNWAEVVQKVMTKNIDVTNLENELAELGLSIFNFDAKQAHIAANLWLHTKKLGLSLADRARFLTCRSFYSAY